MELIIKNSGLEKYFPISRREELSPLDINIIRTKYYEYSLQVACHDGTRHSCLYKVDLNLKPDNPELPDFDGFKKTIQEIRLEIDRLVKILKNKREYKVGVDYEVKNR